MTELAALIERIEKAEGPDRELDADIALAVGPWTERHGLPSGGWVSKGPHHAVVAAPEFTKSIDVALTLVPEGMFWIIGNGKTREHEPLGSAEIFLPTLDNYKTIGEGEHDNPIIALCIAALKAKAASIEPQV